MKQDGDGVRAPRPKGGGAGGTEQLLTDGTGRPSGQNRLARPPHTRKARGSDPSPPPAKPIRREQTPKAGRDSAPPTRSLHGAGHVGFGPVIL